MTFTICRPLKGMTKNYWIGLETGVAEIAVLAHIKPSKLSKKYKKQLNIILENLIGQVEIPPTPRP